MRAVVITSPGGPEVLEVKEVEDPAVGQGDVLIRVTAAGLNRADTLQRKGFHPAPPGASSYPGLECSGVVEAVGQSVDRWKVGDQVCSLIAGGGYAEKVAVPAGQVLPVPAGVSLEEAAALPEVASTVWSTVFMTSRLSPGESFLVHGGSSGIGTFAIQIAKHIGARVFTTAGSAQKLEFCKNLGADVCINYKTEDFVARVKEETDGKGVDVILGPASRRRRNRTLAERERETETEAMIAFSLGFPIDALLDEELRSGGPLPSPAAQNDYIVLRNHILARWRADVRSYLTKSRVRETVSADYEGLMSRAYDFLLEQGYINFGVSSAVRSRFPDEQTCGSVIVVGAGLAGLAAAGQLLGFGFKVLVLEGRDRPGGRVYTEKMTGPDASAVAVDLGGSVITGIHANPLGVLARQLGLPLHNIRWENCPLYRPDGGPVDPRSDREVDAVFNKLLGKASQLRELMGDSASDISLGSAMETLMALYGVARRSEERELLDWHLANLEYANAGCLSDLSVAYWDQDDPYEMGGDHCFLAGGNWRLINAMCRDVPVLYGKTVSCIRYGDSGTEVVAGEQVFQADMVLCTVPLGVLKSGSIRFEPPLPPRKQEAIRRLGFGLLNKVAMVFPYVFWGEDTDTFGCLNDDRSKRGEFFLFYCYHTVSGGPVVIALVAGEAALSFEETDPVITLHHVLAVLRGIYSRKGVVVPDPIQTACTRWGSDPLCLGSYSHIRVGSSGRDYDVLAESTGAGRLFFAGEATSRQYPATMHGAFLSGLREAANILSASRDLTTAEQMEMKTCLQKKGVKLCSHVLVDLFSKPDASFGNFSFVFDPPVSDDPSDMGLVRINFCLAAIGEPQKLEYSSCWSGAEGGGSEQDTPSEAAAVLHLYGILSREQAVQLQLSSGSDACKLALLCRSFSLKLMGQSCLCALGSSLIMSIANARKKGGKSRRRGRPPRVENSNKYTS